jgi:aryl-alcohol dehydrogenase-like predicted oxidoreductase
MDTRKLGQTGIEVTRLGFGGARIGLDHATQEQTTELLNGLLDQGITFIDTASAYLESERMIGNAIAGRRSEFILETKTPTDGGGGSGPTWSKGSITTAIYNSLRDLRTDYLDIVLLHSCDASVLRSGEAVEALADARAAGKTRHIGYSGDGPDALVAIEMGVFSVLQTSFNVVDQSGMDEVIPAASAAGMGIVAKRPIANAAFATEESPYGYADEYWSRSRSLVAPSGAPADRLELSLRFTLSMDEIDTAIVGTTRLDHGLRNIEVAARGPLPAEVVADLRRQFAEHGGGWEQLG